MDDTIRHHGWATLHLIDACSALSDEQLTQPMPATYGSVIETLRHMVDADGWYVFRLAGGGDGHEELEPSAGLEAIRAEATSNSLAWERLLAEGLDPERPIDSPTDEGETIHTYVGLRIAQAAHHGSDHRSQICTALSTMGKEPPAIDVWDYGEATGRLVIDPAPSAGS
jgi:uncharacterized damage-inducible protein DinB